MYRCRSRKCARNLVWQPTTTPKMQNTPAWKLKNKRHANAWSKLMNLQWNTFSWRHWRRLLSRLLSQVPFKLHELRFVRDENHYVDEPTAKQPKSHSPIFEFTNFIISLKACEFVIFGVRCASHDMMAERSCDCLTMPAAAVTTQRWQRQH